MSEIRWEGTEDMVEYACPAMMTRWLSYHCATGLPPAFMLASLPPGSPPISPQDTSEVERRSKRGEKSGVLMVSCRLILSLAHCRFFHYMPLSLISPNLYLLIPGPALQGELLISEVMENSPRHTLQIGSDCLGAKGESYMELG